MGGHSNIPANYEELNARDVNVKETGQIFLYTVVLAAVFFASVFVLYIYFRWELDKVQEANVRTIDNPVYQELKDTADKNLSGAKLSIDEAMKKAAAN